RPFLHQARPENDSGATSAGRGIPRTGRIAVVRASQAGVNARLGARVALGVRVVRVIPGIRFGARVGVVGGGGIVGVVGSAAILIHRNAIVSNGGRRIGRG